MASEGETDLIDLIQSRLNAGKCQQLDHLLHTDLDRHRSAFDRLKRVPKRPSRDHLDLLIKQCHWLDEFGDVDGLLVGIPYLKRRYYANYALALDAGDLKDLVPAKRYTLILTMIQHLRARVRDDLGEMFVRRMATIHQCAQEELEQFLVRQRQRTHAVASQFDAVLALVVEDLSDAELGHRLRRSLGSRLQHWREECAHVRAWSSGNYLPLVWNHFRSHRAVLFRLVRAVTFRPTSQDHALMAALRVVLRHEQDHGDTIAEAVDLSFTTARWRRVITARAKKQPGFQRRELEACVLTHLAASLRAGDVALVGGDSYADYREQLLPWSECQHRLPAYCAKVALPETPTGLVHAIKDELTRVAAEVDAALPTLKDDVTISADGQPVLRRVVAKEIPASAVALERWLDRRLPHRKLLDVLTNLEQWAHFTRHFGPVAGTAPKLKQAPERYLQTLFAMGCNLGATQAARHFTTPVSPHMLSLVHRKHMTVEQLEAATRELTELYLRLELPKVWGDATRVAADGTQYDAYAENLTAGYHFRYRKMGLVAYRHVADNYIAVFRHFIPPGIWEAVYVIEGLLKAGLSVEPDTVYSDTQGQSATVFAFTHLLGIHLMPRIRNWKDLSFSRPDKTISYQHIERLFGEAVNWALIETHWKELMQVALSIQAGTISSPTLLRKLSYGGPWNKLFLAAHELGRAVRTIFLLKWISKLELRQDVTANTNKIEAYNGFAKWLSFGGDVVATNDPHEQQKRLRYNDLIAACVIVQNTVDMSRALEQLEAEPQTLRRADVSFLSPYGTSHLQRFGEYALDLKRPPEPWLDDPIFREALRQARRRITAQAS